VQFPKGAIFYPRGQAGGRFPFKRFYSVFQLLTAKFIIEEIEGDVKKEDIGWGKMLPFSIPPVPKAIY